ncbi:MAG: ISNCY family transposase [Terracidiphilus sp.]
MRESMEIYSRTAAERAMKLQEVLLRATAGKIKWWQAAELIGISARQMRRWRKRLEEQGPKGLLERRLGTPSHRRIPKKQAEKVLGLYRDKYFDLNVRHFHEKLGEEHQIGLSYTWVKQALQAAGLVKRKARRGVHRKRRERRPLPRMMLHIDGSHHQWFQDKRWHDLIVILDDATSEIYYAQLAPEETTFTVMAGLCAVIEQKGLFCSLYSDRGAHFWLTPKSGGKVDYERPTQVNRAMKELGVQMIPSYSPQARGRSERNFSTWQGRLPQELRLRGIGTLDGANEFLREHYIAEFNRRFTVPAAQRGTAFISCRHRNLELVFTQRIERTVDGDNTVSFNNLVMQLERAEWRPTLTGCKVIIHQHLDTTLTLVIAGHRVGHYSAQGKLLTPLTKKHIKAAEKTLRGKVTEQTFPLNLQIPQTARVSHFPIASTATNL